MSDLLSKGERWFADQTEFVDDLENYWGNWGVDSEVGRLRAVLMRRPGPEVEQLKDPATARWLDLMDIDIAQKQHDQLCDIYRDHEVEVYYVEEMDPDKPNALYMRDLFAMTPEGAILARPAIPARRGEERFVAESLIRLGVPIIRTISGKGTFEGADLMWIDRDTVIIGVGNRTNRAGAEQVEEVLRRIGVENFIYFQVPYGQAHIDGRFNPADTDKVVLFPWHTPFEPANALRQRGFELIEVNWPEEAINGGATNFVCIEPGKLVMPEGCPRTQEKLEEAGVEVITIDVSELMKGWGGIHCMTAFLRRDSLNW